MRNSHAAEHISHSPDARSATPLLDPGDPGTRGRAQKDLSTDTGGRMRDDGGDGGGVGYAAAAAARRHQLRSRSPGGITRVARLRYRAAGKQKMVMVAVALAIALVGFVVQTETSVYIQGDLGWNKAYCMLFICHSSLIVLAPIQFLYLKCTKWHLSWRSFLRSHLQLIRSTAQMMQFNTNRISTAQSLVNPVPHFIKQIAIITCTLTVAGSSWFIALNLTTPSDLTAIYNCSTFFAYAFSIPLLGEKVRLGKVFSVAIAILGVMVVAYGDGDGGNVGTDGGGVPTGKDRVLGNLMIGAGSVLYGFYEVLYKKMACPPESTSPGRSAIFANIVASSIGAFTLIVLWFPLVILHWTGIEPFELPTGKAGWMLVVSVVGGLCFSGGFLVLISLTSPVLSSVAALFTIFLVALTDWLLTGVPLTLSAVMGGLLIVGAFALLSWDSWKELKEGEEKRLKRGDDDEDVLEDVEVGEPVFGLSSAEERGRLIRGRD